MDTHLHRLTFGDDGSTRSDEAWQWITRQAWPGWSVDILHAGTAADAHSEPLRPRTAPRRCGFERVRVLSTPLEPTVALARHAGTDVLVIGGRAGDSRASGGLGSVAEALIQHVDVPTVVARQGGAVRRVLAYVGDETPADWSGLAVLQGLPWMEPAVVTVLAVTDPGGPDLRKAQVVVEHLTSAGVRAQLMTVSPHATVAMSRPIHRVVETIDRMRPDLIVLAGPRRSRFAQRITGSVAVEVSRSARCSVLLTRR